MGKIYTFTIFEHVLFFEQTFYDNVYSKQWVILVNLNCINYQLLLFKKEAIIVKRSSLFLFFVKLMVLCFGLNGFKFST